MKRKFISKEETDEQRENFLIFTGEKRETYGTIKRRGYRFQPGDGETSNNVQARQKNINVKVRRNSDGVEMVMRYKAYNDIRFSVEVDGQLKVTLLYQCDEHGNAVGNENLSPEDQEQCEQCFYKWMKK